MSNLQTQSNSISLDELYYMVAHIYSDKIANRSISGTFSHFVEVCGMLTMHAKKKNRDEYTMQDALCKALGWYFPLVAKLKIKSIEELIFRKYPNVCPYCRLEVHKEAVCKQARGASATVNHEELRELYKKNNHLRPKTLNEWQEMFARIYPRDLKSKEWSVISLFEELGELSEAVRVFDLHPKYVIGEAADIFSYLMGIATEYSLELQTEKKPELDLETEFLKRYPGICPQCGYQVCICPSIPEATVGRMAKELDIQDDDNIFEYNINSTNELALKISTNILERLGGYIEFAKNFPTDRGEVNRAIILIYLKLSESLADSNPNKAKLLQEAAVEIGSNLKQAGTKANNDSIRDVVNLLNSVWPEANYSVFNDDNSLVGILARKLQAQSFKFGIVTALPKEFAAMRLMFDNHWKYPVAGDTNDYVIGTIKAVDGSGHHLIVLTLLKEVSNNNAAVAATNLIRSFTSVKNIFMVGIAGGIPCPGNAEKHVRLGDVVVSESGVIQYDNLSIGMKEINYRSSSSKSSAQIIGIVKQLEANRTIGEHPWEKYILKGVELENGTRPDQDTDKLFDWHGVEEQQIIHPFDNKRRSNQPKIHYGKIGAANILLRNPLLRDQVAKECRVIAIEMEGSGIADSSWNASINSIIIRGICDYCDPKKNDIWQEYAAVAAAAYARCILEAISISPNES